MTAPGLPARVPLSALGRLGDLAYSGGGQSEGIWRVPAQPGSLFKRYKPEISIDVPGADLDRLIALPATLTDPTDRQLIARATSWPTSRVVDGRRTVGVVMPEAPNELMVSWRPPRSRNGAVRHSLLEIDMLAKPDGFLADRGIRAPGTAAREAICHTLARIAELFERQGIVYADWSYANAFWHPARHTVYLIDVDACSFGPRKHVNTAQFEDPFTPFGVPVDTYVDRYRVALLITRILTRVRDAAEAISAVGAMRGQVPEVLFRILTADSRTARPTLRQLLGAFDGSPTTVPGAGRTRSPGGTHHVPSTRVDADPTGVIGWRNTPGRSNAAPHLLRPQPAGRTGHSRPARPNIAKVSPAQPTAGRAVAGSASVGSASPGGGPYVVAPTRQAAAPTVPPAASKHRSPPAVPAPASSGKSDALEFGCGLFVLVVVAIAVVGLVVVVTRGVTALLS